MAGKTLTFYSCACFVTDNIFLEDYKAHVRFQNDQQFKRDYGVFLRDKGCTTEQQLSSLLAKIQKEVERRRSLNRQSTERKEKILKSYKPLHPDVYVLQPSFLSQEFLQIVTYCRSQDATVNGLLERIQSLRGPRVYRIPVFTAGFCGDLIEELENFEQSEMPKGRPNTMNNYGITLSELGFDESFITPLREHYLQPITSLLYPDHGGDQLDSHKAFVVKYSVDEDLDLSTHYDNAEVTLNISLGKTFTEGNLYFGDMKEIPLLTSECVQVTHTVTQGVLHRGGQLHGAFPIESGERWNLIVWMRSSSIRNHLCPMCNKKPDLVEAVGFGDGFTKDSEENTYESVDVCTLI